MLVLYAIVKKKEKERSAPNPQICFSPKLIYLLFEILLQMNFWIRLNPRFSVPQRNLENSSKKLPFCLVTEFEENGSSGCCDVYPGRLNISRPLISLRIVQYTFDMQYTVHMQYTFAFQKCYRLLQQYPKFKGRYTVQFTGDGWSLVY